jgi:hypothetical protein
MRENIKGMWNKLIERQLDEANLDRNIKQRTNRGLDRLTKNTYFNDIPIGEIKDILDDHNIVMLQEDYTEFDGFFTGEEGRESIALAYRDSLEGIRYEPFLNTNLILSWYQRRETGHYEIVAYLS